MITLEQAKNLSYGDILYHTIHKNADGTPQRWKVNGKVKTWKRSPEKVKVPLKHGLKTFDYITEEDLELVCLKKGDALLEENLNLNNNDPELVKWLKARGWKGETTKIVEGRFAISSFNLPNGKILCKVYYDNIEMSYRVFVPKEVSL